MDDPLCLKPWYSYIIMFIFKLPFLLKIEIQEIAHAFRKSVFILAHGCEVPT